MKTAASEADNTLNVMQNVDSQLAALGMQEPQGWESMSYDQKVQYLDQMQSSLQKTQTMTDTLQKANDQKQKMMSDLQNLGIDQSKVPPQPSPVVASKRFNLKRFSQMAQPQMPTTEQTPISPMEQIPEESMAEDPDDKGSTSTSQVRQILDGLVDQEMQNGVDETTAKSQAVDKAYQEITSKYTNPNQSTSDPFSSNVQGNSQQTVRDAVNSYYSTDDESEKDRAAAVLARTIFPQDSTQNGSIDDGEVAGQPEQGIKVNVAKFVNHTNEIIKKLASSHTHSTKKTVFNLNKFAHVKNVTVFNPELAIKDEFYGGPMSENDLLERNKGYGIQLDGIYSLNWEKVWRENVMDKYDPLYIERRFEIDRNIPETNNYQLNPGEKRRITPPEYGILEGRLEANRTGMNKDRGYSPAEDGKPFNWKKAHQEKMAQKAPTPQDMGISNPMKPAPMQKQEWLCHACQNPLAVTSTNMPMDRCNACGALQHGKAIPGKFKTGPDPAKKSPSAVINNGGPILAETDVEKLAEATGGVFFDSNDLKFFVVAGKKKKKFDTYYEAEEFKMLAKEPVQNSNDTTKKKIKLTPEQAEKQRQIANHADALGIDG